MERKKTISSEEFSILSATEKPVHPDECFCGSTSFFENLYGFECYSCGQTLTPKLTKELVHWTEIEDFW